jgi:prefoldin subunit 5
MDVLIIEFRIEELEHEILRTQDKIDKLEKKKTEIKGAIAEMWKWHDTVKDAQGYGQITFDGKSKVLKLPELGSPEAIKNAIENRREAIDGEDEKLVQKIRTEKMRGRSQRAIDLMDGEGPDESGE